MKKSVFLFISIIINLILLSLCVYYVSTNKLKVSSLYINNVKQYAPHFDRGKPVDRYYIEDYINNHKEYITGDVLEMQSDLYASANGHDINKVEILDFSPDNKEATFSGDLQYPEQMPENRYDCYILTQTLQYPFDLKSTLKSVHKMLKKNGVVLITVPVTTQYCNEPGLYDESWRFTEYSLKRLLEDADFEIKDIRSYGNTLAAVMFLNGYAVEDIKNPKDLDVYEPSDPILVAATAMKK